MTNAPEPYDSLPQVVAVLDEYKIVINRGSRDSVEVGDRFLVFLLGENIIDPETGESLGHLEIVRGKARASHVQERLTTLEAYELRDRGGRKKITKIPGISIMGIGSNEIIEDIVEEVMPLDAEKGDFAKPI